MKQIQFFNHVIDVLESLDITYAVVGSLASGSYGEPRYTQDIDIVVKLIDEDIPALIRAFPEPDFYLSREAAKDAIRQGGQFNIIHAASGQKADLMPCGSDLWSRHQIARRVSMEVVPGKKAYTASPEDVIIAKMLFYREGGSEKHPRDIAGILKVQKERIDRSYIEGWVKEFGLSDIWTAVLNRIG